MNQPRRNNNGQQNQQRRHARVVVHKPTDLWRPVPQLPEVDKIVATQDPARWCCR